MTLEQSGDNLGGVLQTAHGRFTVRGRVSDGTQVTLFSDPVPVAIPCTGKPAPFGETRLVERFTRLVAGKSLVGTYTSEQFTSFNVGGTNTCPAGTVRIVAEDVRLIRVPVP